MDKPELTPTQLSEELSTELILKLQQLGYRVNGQLCKVLCAACDKVAKAVSTEGDLPSWVIDGADEGLVGIIDITDPSSPLQYWDEGWTGIDGIMDDCNGQE